MSLEHWENVQREMGNKTAADMARVLRNGYGDVPFPKEALDVPAAPESEVPVTELSFTESQRTALLEAGYLIYSLPGLSISEMMINHPDLVHSTLSRHAPALEKAPSRTGDVAIHPGMLFLPGSFDLPFEQLQTLVLNLSQQLSAQIPGIQAIIGQPQDYVAITLAHDTTEHHLFAFIKGHCWTVATDSSGALIIPVGEYHYTRDGGWSGGLGINVGTPFTASPETHFSYAGIAPLIVPIAE